MRLQNMTLEGDTVVIHTDAVIVGSGAGGGVTAALLAEAGAQVCHDRPHGPVYMQHSMLSIAAMRARPTHHLPAAANARPKLCVRTLLWVLMLRREHFCPPYRAVGTKQRRVSHYIAQGIIFELQVVVLEKGRFTPAAELTLRERDSSKEMYEMGTLLTTQDAGAFMRDPIKVMELYSWLCSLSSNLKPGHILRTDALITPSAGVHAVHLQCISTCCKAHHLQRHREASC